MKIAASEQERAGCRRVRARKTPEVAVRVEVQVVVKVGAVVVVNVVHVRQSQCKSISTG